MADVNATLFTPINIRIPQQPDPAIPEPMFSALNESYNAISQLINTLDNLCGPGTKRELRWPTLVESDTLIVGNLCRLYAKAGEAMVFGAMGSIYDNAGARNVRNANATDNTKPCHCFCNTPGGVGAGAYAEFICPTGLLSVVGVVRGTMYYTGTVNGQITAVRPVAVGNVEQFLGFGINTNLLLFNVGGYIQH